MRNISFALTTEQVRNQTKTVTRRLGWTLSIPMVCPLCHADVPPKTRHECSKAEQTPSAKRTK